MVDRHLLLLFVRKISQSTERSSSFEQFTLLHTTTAIFAVRSFGLAMIAGRGGSRSTIALAAVTALGWQVLGTNAECKFRFEGYLNISEPPTWVVPSAEAFSSGSNYVLNEWNPIVYLGETERAALPSVAAHVRVDSELLL